MSSLFPLYVWTWSFSADARAGALSGGSPNLGTNLMMILLLLLPAVLAARGEALAALGSVATVLGGALALTINRSAALGAAAGGLWLAARRAPVLLTLGLAGLAAGTAAFPETRPVIRLRSIVRYQDSASAAERFSLWRSGCHMVRDRPLAGFTGRRKFMDALYGRYQLPGGTYSLPRAGHVHNSFLQTAVLHGVPGLGLLLWWLAVLCRMAWRARGTCAARFYEDGALLARGLVAMLIGVLLNAQFDFVLGHGGQHSIVFYALTGTILGSLIAPRGGRRS